MWFDFREYLYLETWKQRHHLIEQPITSSLWRIFSSAIQARKLKIKPYIIDTLKHLILISQCMSPAFRPINSDNYAPIKTIQDAYHNIYRLNTFDHFPTLMGMGFLRDADFLYYSLNLPTVYEGHYEKGTDNFIFEQRKIKLALDTLYKHVASKNNVTGKSIVDSITRLNFDHFHKNQDEDNELLSSKHIIKDDKNFIRTSRSYSNSFYSKSQFFSGCIRLSKKPTNERSQ